MLRADSVSFAYGRDQPDVLNRVTVDIGDGTIAGLLGPNGSGKTTLLRVLGGMLRPRSGHVTVNGVAMRDLSRKALARQLAVVPQETHSTFDFTVLDIV